MPFAYYSRLTRSQQRIYRRSDEIATIPLPQATPLHPLVEQLAEALKNEDRRKIEVLSQGLISDLTTMLKVPHVQVEVLAARPSKDWGELHGLYTPAEGRRPARVTVWMRTAKHRRVVAFRTFLRTLLHELCHHLDYELLDLEESFHTEGFYKRESKLFHQLVPNRPHHDPLATQG